ncbi:ABC transporter ATP-binding protein [Spiroplasma clarkii]|uniref:ABC transporter ATP-binding protein n=1 Tax=Spiroplasma clarkii TaxID=2139 RepID=UPI001F230AA1|nr:ABC transporter ATP-binding protein [Spiroplasma clarkii]
MKNQKKQVFILKNNLYKQIWQSLKDRWFLASLMLTLTIFMSLLLITNIKIIEYITALLVSKSVIDAANNVEKANGFFSRWVTDPNLQKIILENLNNTIKDREAFLQDVIETFFYSNVNYTNHTVYLVLWGLNLNLYNLVEIMIVDIALVILVVYIVYIISGYIAGSYEAKIRKALIDKLIDQDLDYFSQNKTGELIGTLVKESSILAKHIKEAPANYTLSSVTILISSIMMFKINWKLASSVFGLLAIFLILVFIFILITNSSTKKIHQASQKLDNNLTEKVYSIRLIKSSGTFNKEKTEFQESINFVDKKNKGKLFLAEIPNALIVGGIGSFSMASIIFGVFLYYEQTQALVSVMTAFTAGVIVMTLPILQLRQVIADEPAAHVAAASVVRILDSTICIDKHKTQIISEPLTEICFENVEFKYPSSDEIILKNLDIELKKNYKYAFVGPTGSGKSTIAKLILRFYDPSSGLIKINQKYNLQDLNLKSWLDKIGYVDQEPQILSGTIYANIAYGLDNVSNEDIVIAAKKAKLHDLIMSWSDGYDTILFECGSQLSGGQKQRLVIARLILKDPEILILDEATSALDNIVEAEIQAELEKLMVGRTTIAIAHRLSTIKSFDKILYLNQEWELFRLEPLMT